MNEPSTPSYSTAAEYFWEKAEYFNRRCAERIHPALAALFAKEAVLHMDAWAYLAYNLDAPL